MTAAQTTDSLFKGVYAITDDKLIPEDRLIEVCEHALRGGVRLLQYRSKETSKSFSRRREEAAALTTLCNRYGACLLVNDDIDLCQAAEAHGVHLGQKDGSVPEARWRLGPQAIIGVTCHNRDDLVLAAEKQGATYAALGRFFPSNTKPEASAASIEDLKRIRSQTRLPLVAIGGVTADNGSEVLEAGADMLAVIHYLFSAEDVFARAQALSSLFRHTR
ncbi:MAG TPA: thiamine phosphate synthase [Pseudohongiella sp.]|nr:thiamine phosphate synthase [Pseudohongiella sp.]